MAKMVYEATHRVRVFAYLFSILFVQDVDILPFHPAGGINQEQAYIGRFNGADGPQHGIKLQVLRYLAFLPEPCCIDQVKIMVELTVPGQDGITGGPGNGGNDIPFFPDEGIDQGGFPDVGLACNGDGYPMPDGISHPEGIHQGADHNMNFPDQACQLLPVGKFHILLTEIKFKLNKRSEF